MRSSAALHRNLRPNILLLAAVVLAGCAGSARHRGPRVLEPDSSAPARMATSAPAAGLLLGIDVLEQQGFAPLRGKRIGLLTHPAAVNRFGVSTLDVIFRDKRNHLVALYAVEHGIHGDIPAGQKFEDHIDARTGLKVFSLYTGRTHKPTPEQLRGIDVFVIDLQDVGTRSYTFISAMRLAMEACFENNVEVVVLDRPNPLGGLKVAGPPMEAKWLNYLGAYRIPYVYGLTIGELARMSWSEPGMLQIPEAVRRRGRITVVPMRGWRRDMTWPETGLPWIPTSPNIPDFDAVVGYPMTGLGAQLGGFRHGIGTPHPFRLLSHPAIPPAKLLAELRQRHIPGLSFVPRTVTVADARGQPRTIEGVYVKVSNWKVWRPTELDLHMMQLAARAAAPKNPFAEASEAAANLFNRHAGSDALWRALTHDPARLDIARIWAEWEKDARSFQQRSRKYWLYR